MDHHHVDIELRPDPEFSAPQLMNALYAKLHRALVRLGANNIGVSFPRHNATAPYLGNCLRLHGPRDALISLMNADWLRGMHDHVMLSAVQAVPDGAERRAVRRVQAKSNPERLRRRLMRRHSICEQEALQRIPNTAVETLRLPFLQLNSESTGHSFRLFIAHTPAGHSDTAGTYNSYGFSQTATVPWF